MFKTDNTKIGSYLAALIKNSKYKNDRQFSIAYLTLRDGAANPDDIQNMQNRICQIKKGKKGVQIEDLPIFSELLGVSIENILSAGTALVPASTRKSNYSIAYSKDPAEWEAYINLESKPILKPDEFDKTAIDYALEAGNYPFLKYLMEKEYIWFTKKDESGDCVGFCAGTSIKFNFRERTDYLDCRLEREDDLRLKLISLALKNEDFEMLDKLHAREIPLLYTISYSSCQIASPDSFPNIPNSFKQLIRDIAQSKRNVIAYFFKEFEIKTQQDSINTFIFPYTGEILDVLIEKKRLSECKYLLKIAVEHNQKVQRNFQNLFNKSMEMCREYYANCGYESIRNEAYYKKENLYSYRFFPESGFIAFATPYYIPKVICFVTNIAKITQNSSDTEVQCLIHELNKTYDFFINYLSEKEGKQDESHL